MDLSKLYDIAGKTEPTIGSVLDPNSRAVDRNDTTEAVLTPVSGADVANSASVPFGVNHPAWILLVGACKGFNLEPEDAWQALGDDQAAIVEGNISRGLVMAFCKALADTRTRERGERPAHLYTTGHVRRLRACMALA